MPRSVVWWQQFRHLGPSVVLFGCWSGCSRRSRDVEPVVRDFDASGAGQRSGGSGPPLLDQPPDLGGSAPSGEAWTAWTSLRQDTRRPPMDAVARVGPIGVAPCWMYGATAACDRAWYTPANGPSQVERMPILIGSPVRLTVVSGAAGVCRSPRSRRARASPPALFASAPPQPPLPQRGRVQDGEQQLPAPPLIRGHPPLSFPSYFDEASSRPSVGTAHSCRNPASASGPPAADACPLWLSPVAGGRAPHPPREC